MIGWLLRLSDAVRDRGRTRCWPADRAAGRRGEDLAHRYLERCGMTVVARNWQPSVGQGEIDLVAWEGDRLVFVEVKARAGDQFGAPERNVDAGKREALDARRAQLRAAGRRGLGEGAVRPRQRGPRPSRRNLAPQGCLPPESDAIIGDSLFRPLKGSGGSPIARVPSRPDHRQVGHHRDRPRTSAPGLFPRAGCHQGRPLLPVLPRQRNEDSPRVARLPPERRGQRARLDAARGAQQVPGAARRRRLRPPGRGPLRPHERHRRARGRHRDAGPPVDLGQDDRPAPSRTSSGPSATASWI